MSKGAFGVSSLGIKLNYWLEQYGVALLGFDEKALSLPTVTERCFQMVDAITKAGHTITGFTSKSVVTIVGVVRVEDGNLVCVSPQDVTLRYFVPLADLRTCRITLGCAPANLAAIAQWWANALNARRHLASPAITPEQVERFRVSLLELLPALMDCSGDVNVSVDYEPDATLLMAGERAGIAKVGNYLPRKSATCLTPERLIACEGYNGTTQTLFEVEI